MEVDMAMEPLTEGQKDSLLVFFCNLTLDLHGSLVALHDTDGKTCECRACRLARNLMGILPIEEGGV